MAASPPVSLKNRIKIIMVDFEPPLHCRHCCVSPFRAAIYVAFLLAWAYSPHSINGRQPLGSAAIWVGLISAIYAIVGGLFARGAQRLLIVVSSMAVAF